MILNTMPESNPNGGSLWHSSTSILSSHNDFHSRGNNDELNSKESDNIMDLNSYTLDARILQKKDQIEELSPSGQILLAPTVEEVRTGQQFLINLQLSAPLASLATLGAPSPSKYPTMRVDRREAINTAGKPRAKDEPLTLQIIVHLANSGQIRKGACAKCCHKYGPSSPILVLLDPLSPSSTDPTSFSHIDSSAGSVTILAKVICSSTDHGERGNKDRYLFEFRLKRTNRSKSSSASRGGMVDENDKDTIASCVTAPIMCSGHHKAKRIYPTQRAAKTTKEGGPTAKVKTIKHQKSINVDAAFRSSNLFSDQQPYGRSGSMSSISNYPSPFSYVQDNLHSSSMASNLGDDQSNSDLDAISSVGGRSRQPSLLNATYESSSASFSHQFPPQPPRIFEVRPDQGPIRKMTDVVLRGLFFRDGMIPYFGCFPAQDIVVETSNLIICKAPETPLPGTVSITIYDTAGTQFSDLAQFTYTDDSETELLILQLQLRMAHRALEYLHTQATGQRGNANEILRDIPGLSQSGSRNGSPSGGGTMLIAEGEGADMGTAESETLTLEQVEEGILKTLDQLPGTVDLSMQLKNQGNMLHLSVLLGFHKLATRLIEEGCELEAQDVWAMTPLMYAVVKGCESIVKALVLAGATSSGARTPKEFYSCLPRAVDPTQAVVGYISIACTRHSSTTRALIAGSVSGKSDTVQIENDYGPFASSSSSDEDSDMAEEGTADTQAVSSTTDMPAAAATSDNGDEDEAETMSKIAEAIRGVYINHDMPPLDQQNLPPMHTVGPDGSIVVNNKVLKGDEIPRGVVPPESNTQSDNNESGYYSGVYSEVQDRLSHLSRAALPSEDVHMIVEFKKGPSQPAAASSSTSSAPVVAAPENLFRTGDTFSIEIRLATVPMPGSTLPAVPLPSEFLGIRLPHEMVKRVQQEQPVSILNEMTYNLNMSIQLGKNPMTDPQEHEHAHQQEHDHGYQGDGILLPGACTSCSKLLHEHKRISPSRLSKEDSSLYPILQFHVPSVPTLALLPEDADTSTNVDLSSGVMEVRNGHLEVKARVNCSSLHHLIQREKARRTAEMQQQQHEHQEREARPSSSSTPSLVRTRMDLKEIEDPGFVFSFELIHPTKNTVVAKFETDPILFQTYSRGRH
ncbi:SPT3 Dosage dependent suppressor of Ty-induced promoter mutations-like protein [Gryganskiella cystojenkinii]|nr:SPT3 Dosage dependent suppressor of Ty-induced promoter mutations-like protein [Gryganskiella cystojenkinii]